MNIRTALAATVGVVFVALALWPVRMAVSPSAGEFRAMPSVSGKPLFLSWLCYALAVGVALVAWQHAT